MRCRKCKKEYPTLAKDGICWKCARKIIKKRK